jgi:YVTN family beta-propeller protein
MPTVTSPRRARYARHALLALVLTTTIALLASGCATGREEGAGVATGGGVSGGGVGSGGAESDSGLAGAWGGALDTIPGPPPGGLLLVNTINDDAMLFLDASSGRPIARARLGYDPDEFAISPDRLEAYVVNTRGEASDLGSISIVSIPGQHEVIRLDPHPYGRLDGVVASRDRVHLYAAATFGGSILQFNLVSRHLDQAYRMPGVPHLLALDLTENTLFATDRNASLLYALDLTSGQVRSIPVGRAPEAVVMTPDGFTLWVACRGDGTVAVVDPATMTVRNTMITGREPVRIAFTPDGNRALVVNAGESSVSVFDARGLVRLGSIPVAVSPIDVAVSDDNRHAWVISDRDDRMSMIDLTSGSEVGRVSIGQPAVSLRWVAPP